MHNSMHYDAIQGQSHEPLKVGNEYEYDYVVLSVLTVLCCEDYQCLSDGGHRIFCGLAVEIDGLNCQWENQPVQ